MMEPWAITLSPADQACLAALRLVPGLLTGEDGGQVWVRGAGGDESLDAKLRALPANARYRIGQGDVLFLEGHRVPSGTLPKLAWRTLIDSLKPTFPLQTLGGELLSLASLRLVRSSQAHPANLLLTDTATWMAWAVEAPEIRLKQLRIAASDDGRVVICGQPLPPVDGTRFVERSGIAVPVGWEWTPALEPEALRVAFELSDGAIALWEADGWSPIGAEQFVAASRHGARQLGTASTST